MEYGVESLCGGSHEKFSSVRVTFFFSCDRSQFSFQKKTGRSEVSHVIRSLQNVVPNLKSYESIRESWRVLKSPYGLVVHMTRYEIPTHTHTWNTKHRYTTIRWFRNSWHGEKRAMSLSRPWQRHSIVTWFEVFEIILHSVVLCVRFPLRESYTHASTHTHTHRHTSQIPRWRYQHRLH